MSDIRKAQDRREFRTEALSLWRITFGPLVWALHFAVSYAATALVCAKLGEEAVAPLRWGIGLGTLLALALIFWLGLQAWRQWDLRGDPEWENDEGSSEDRHRFLGHAAFLLALISFIGVVYVALPALMIGSCA